MGATWTADLPAGATFTAVVDGTGLGNPAEAGRYSDFGSVGTYAFTLTTQPGTTLTPPVATSPPPTPTPTPTDATTATPTATPAVGTTTPPPTAAAIGFVSTHLPKARAGVRYRATIRFTGPVEEALVDWRLPQGLTWRVRGDTILIRGTVRRPIVRSFGTELAGDGASVRQRFRLVVR